jgi:hypothetical protein
MPFTNREPALRAAKTIVSRRELMEGTMIETVYNSRLVETSMPKRHLHFAPCKDKAATVAARVHTYYPLLNKAVIKEAMPLT